MAKRLLRIDVTPSSFWRPIAGREWFIAQGVNV
jgi:hypothetical protein